MKSFALLIPLLIVPATALAEEAPLSHEQIKSTVEKHLSEVKACMKQHGSATGKLVVQFAIQPDGHVGDAKPHQASSNGALDRCIAGAFQKWQFPKPRGGVLMGVVYPFTFSAPKPTEGSLAESQIASVVNSHNEEVKGCYNEALKKKADLAGTMHVTLAIAASGSVESARVQDSNTKFDSLDQCVVGKVKTWVFPKPAGNAGFQFTYPIVFTPPKS